MNLFDINNMMLKNKKSLIIFFIITIRKHEDLNRINTLLTECRKTINKLVRFKGKIVEIDEIKTFINKRI